MKVPSHNLICHYIPDIPYQFGRGAPISAEAHITCSPPPPPDASSTTIIIWRYDYARKQYFELAESTSNKSSVDWWIKTTGNCAAKIKYAFHTEVINDSFHGNWGHTDTNSTTVDLYC